MKGTLKQNVKRKLFNVLKDNVPYRTNLRPDNVCERLEDLLRAGCRYYEVYKDYKTVLPVEKVFFDKLAPFTIYDEYEEAPGGIVNMKYQYDYGVLQIPNGRVYSNNVDYISIITGNNKLVDKYSYQYKTQRYASSWENKILSQKYFIDPVEIDGNVFVMLAGFAATYNIFHWFIDSLPRLHLLKKSGLFDEIDYFLVPSYKYDYQIDSLQLLGIGKDRILVGKEDTHIRAKNIVVSTHPRGERSYLLPEWMTDFYRTEYLKPTLKDPAYPKKIFISRKDSSFRQIINEDEVFQKLKSMGFVSVKLSEHPFTEKMKLFYNAEIIIGSGAGLTSLFFVNENARLIEIFPQGFVDTHFYNIARNVGLDYSPIICMNEKPSTDAESGKMEDMQVNIEELVVALTKRQVEQ